MNIKACAKAQEKLEGNHGGAGEEDRLGVGIFGGGMWKGKGRRCVEVRCEIHLSLKMSPKHSHRKACEVLK